MALSIRKRSLRLKTTNDAAYSAPAVGDWIRTVELDPQPIAVNTVDLNTDRAVLGAPKRILVSTGGTIGFGAPLSGHGKSAGNAAPNLAPVYEICGMIQGDVVAGAAAWATGTEYVVGATVTDAGKNYECIQAHTASNANKPSVAGGKAYWREYLVGKYYQTGDVSKYASALVNIDGQDFEFRSLRGNMSFDITTGGLPQANVTLQGLAGERQTRAAGNLQASNYTDPIPVNNTNTTDCLLHGQVMNMLGLTVDLGNTVETFDQPGVVDVAILDRNVTGTMRAEMPKINVKDWWAAAQALTEAPLRVVHGGALNAGKGVIVTAPNVSVSDISVVDESRRAILDISLIFNPGASGNDDFRITYV